MNKSYEKYFKTQFSYDLKAAVTVFLVAIPLSLGIALASGVPVISGLIAGVIGGIVVGYLSGSSLSVSGCAAGLVPVVTLSLLELRSAELLFAAITLSGFVQYVFGRLKAGVIAHYIPYAVIKGMLAAIGIIIIYKQLPHLIGYHDEIFDDTLNISENYGFDLHDKLWMILNSISLGPIIISIVSFTMIYLCTSNWVKRYSLTRIVTDYVPSSLIAIIFAILINHIFYLFFPALALSGVHLVNIPSIKDLMSSTIFAFDVSAFKNPLVYKYGLIIALISSIETLLSIEACDKLDPNKKVTPTGKELKAQGVGNFLSGLVGGLPITSVIIRTSVNIENNAQTKMSTIMHGILILFSVLFLTKIINQIPLASLACILIITGYKLTHEKLIKDMFKKGAHHFIPFVTTIVAILCTDLLRGVFIGLVVSVFFILKNYYTLQNIRVHSNQEAKEYTMVFGEYTTFLSKASIARLLNEIQDNSKLKLDFSNCTMLDYEINELINDYILSVKSKGITLVIIPNCTKNINFSVP